MIITPAQCRAARAILGWHQSTLAKQAGVHVNVIHKFERGETDPRGSTLNAIQHAFEEAGIEFIPGGARQVHKNVTASPSSPTPP